VLALDGSNWQRVDLFDFQTDIEVCLVQIILYDTVNMYSTLQYSKLTFSKSHLLARHKKIQSSKKKLEGEDSS